jgi:hypothetical protein
MYAKILPRAKALFAPPQHQIAPQKSRPMHFSRSQFRRSGNYMPVVQQNGIIDHGPGVFSFSAISFRAESRGKTAPEDITG